jgi:hypothetical protein
VATMDASRSTATRPWSSTWCSRQHRIDEESKSVQRVGSHLLPESFPGVLGRERRQRWRQCHFERTLKLASAVHGQPPVLRRVVRLSCTSASPPTAPRGLPSRGTTWAWRSATPWLIFCFYLFRLPAGGDGRHYLQT